MSESFLETGLFLVPVVKSACDLQVLFPAILRPATVDLILMKQTLMMTRMHTIQANMKPSIHTATLFALTILPPRELFDQDISHAFFK